MRIPALTIPSVNAHTHASDSAHARLTCPSSRFMCATACSWSPGDDQWLPRQDRRGARKVRLGQRSRLAGQVGCVKCIRGQVRWSVMHARTLVSERYSEPASAMRPATARQGSVMTRGTIRRHSEKLSPAKSPGKCMQTEVCYNMRRGGRKSTKPKSARRRALGRCQAVSPLCCVGFQRSGVGSRGLQLVLSVVGARPTFWILDPPPPLLPP